MKTKQKNKEKRMSVSQTTRMYLVENNGLISYVDAQRLAEDCKVKFISINRFLQNDKRKDRVWGFVRLNAQGERTNKRNEPWYFKCMSRKSFKALKREMSTTVLNKK